MPTWSDGRLTGDRSKGEQENEGEYAEDGADDDRRDRLLGHAHVGPVGVVAVVEVSLDDLRPRGALEADPLVVELLDEAPAATTLLVEDGAELPRVAERGEVGAEDLEFPALDQFFRSVGGHVFFLKPLHLRGGSGGGSRAHRWGLGTLCAGCRLSIRSPGRFIIEEGPRSAPLLNDRASARGPS